MFKNLSNVFRDFKNYFFPDRNPFGNKILASKDYYLSIYEKAKKEKFLEIDILENSTGFKVDKSWLDKLALHTQVVKKKSAINYQHGRVLYSLLRKYIQDQNINYIKILEIGTARGFSSICMSKAINDTGIKGVINTIDIIPHKKEIYWNCIDDFEGKKTRENLLSFWSEELKNINFLTGPSSYVLNKTKMEKINFAFIDGMHDYYNVKKELNFVKERQSIGDIIICDDYDLDKFEGVVKALNDEDFSRKYNVLDFSSDPQRTYAIATRIK